MTIDLPCKIGDALYAPARGRVSVFRVRGFHITRDGVFVEWRIESGITGPYRMSGVCHSEIGTAVFLTEEEAKTAAEHADI